MKCTCKHCGTIFRAGQGRGEFCCAGCEQVYHLIRDEGLGAYYDLQNNPGRPLEGTPFEAEGDYAWAEKLQMQTEGRTSCPELRVRVDGMFCLGCIWLIERLAQREPGCFMARASLENRSLHLKWKGGEFNLKRLVKALGRFGYRVEPGATAGRAVLSTLAWRVILCFVFAVNALMLQLPQWLGLKDFAYADLFSLLALVCVVMSSVIGCAHFIVPAGRSLRMGRIHFDLLPALGLGLYFLWAVLSSVFSLEPNSASWAFPVLVFITLGSRWLQEQYWQRCGLRLEMDELRRATSAKRMQMLIRLYTLGVLAIVLVHTYVMVLQAGWEQEWVGHATGMLIVGVVYPMVLAANEAPGWGYVLTGILINMAGICFIIFGGMNPLLSACWMGLGGLVWQALFIWRPSSPPRQAY